jgi:hypothetical protein
MPPLALKFARAVIIAIVVTIVLFVLGTVLDQIKVEIATTIGKLLIGWLGVAIGILAGLWYFFFTP